jgi:hypothetical protein
MELLLLLLILLHSVEKLKLTVKFQKTAKKVNTHTMTVIVMMIVMMIAMHAKSTLTSPSFASVPISKTVLSLVEQELVVSAVSITSQLMLKQSAMYQFQILLPSTRQPPTPADLR